MRAVRIVPFICLLFIGVMLLSGVVYSLMTGTAYAVGTVPVFFFLGNYLIKMYLSAGAVIPVYFFILAFLIIREGDAWRSLITLNLLIFPYLTAVALIRVLQANDSVYIAPLLQQLILSLGSIGATIVLFALLSIELVLIIGGVLYFDIGGSVVKEEHSYVEDNPETHEFTENEQHIPEESHVTAVIETKEKEVIPGTLRFPSYPSEKNADDFVEKSRDILHHEEYSNATEIAYEDNVDTYSAEMGTHFNEASLPITDAPEEGQYDGGDDVVYDSDELVKKKDNFPEQSNHPVISPHIQLEPQSEDALVSDSYVEQLLSKTEEAPIIPIPYKKGNRYHIPTKGVLNAFVPTDSTLATKDIQHLAHILEQTFEEFNIEAKVTEMRHGPTVTMYEVVPASGVRVNRIVSLSDNIALRLAAPSVRIVAPIPGRKTIGIEVPNKQRRLVSFISVIESLEQQKKKYYLPIALGCSISGENYVFDISSAPHLLIAGTTGSGKSVCVNSIICSLLYFCPPEDVRMLLIDPKVVELSFYNGIPHLLTPVINDPKHAIKALSWATSEMERRYKELDKLGVRDLISYNDRIKKRQLKKETLPFIVIIIDEFADLMAVTGKEAEYLLARLAAKSRAVGIHLIAATQRPSADVITGLIKANIPSRIAFMVASKTDSRIILDANGAEKLLGKGDMLYVSATDPFPIRLQGAYVSEQEVERVVQKVKENGGPVRYISDEIFVEEDESDYTADADDDALWGDAVEIAHTEQKISISYLQRKLKIGYNRAARLVEAMEAQGIVGAPQSGGKRDILVKKSV